jgi:hypothetical protein
MCQFLSGNSRSGYEAHMCHFFIRERRGSYESHMCQIFRTTAARLSAPYDAKVKVLIKSAKAVILNLFG